MTGSLSSRALVLPCVAFVFLGGAAWDTGSARGDEPAVGGAGPWEKVRVTDGVTVHRRRIEGSRLYEMRGRAVINTPVSRVLAYLEGMQQRPETRDCPAVSPNADGLPAALVYDRTKSPWPVADRDTLLRAELQVNMERHVVRAIFRSITMPCMPPQRGVVRMPSVRGHWVARAVQGGQATLVEYRAHADPGGSLPTWVVNLAAKQIPLVAVRVLRDEANSQRYDRAVATIAARPEYVRLIQGVPNHPVPGDADPDVADLPAAATTASR